MKLIVFDCGYFTSNNSQSVKYILRDVNRVVAHDSGTPL